MKSWKTTLAGILGAAATGAISCVQTGTVDPQTVALMAGLAAVGYLAKDHTKE